MKIVEWYKNLIHERRKKFMKMNPEQVKIVNDEIEQIKKISSDKSTQRYRDEIENQRRNDGNCPHCGNTDINNRIAQVIGSGSVSGSFSLGFGSVYGSSSIDTNEVNNCTKCGNQWKKYKISHTSNDNELGTLLNYIDTHIEGKYDFGTSYYNELKHFHAETIYSLIQSTYEMYTYSSTRELSLSTLRNYFKSVFDVN